MNARHRFRVKPGRRFRPHDVDPDETGDYRHKSEVDELTSAMAREIDGLQQTLYAERSRSLLLILQGMDTSGKDGTVRHVMSGVNPQGCFVTSFKVPNAEEASHDYLWRVHHAAPPKGYIGIFNRSHYEDVLVTRVHGLITSKEAKERYREINDFERLLVKHGTTIVKVYLAISKDEQKKRLQARLDDPKKHWKFSENDLTERKKWNSYQAAYAEAITATSTPEAPWHVVPANHKWYRNFVVAKLVHETLLKMDPKIPDQSAKDFKGIRVR
jgi:PPK2 family polyphosphate:nucleotide phosphotransferase